VERIEAVADSLKAARDAGDDVVVVVSAMSGETNRLIDLAQQVTEDPAPREMDVLVSTGEQVTIALLAMALFEARCGCTVVHRQPGSDHYGQRPYKGPYTEH